YVTHQTQDEESCHGAGSRCCIEKSQSACTNVIDLIRVRRKCSTRHPKYHRNEVGIKNRCKHSSFAHKPKAFGDRRQFKSALRRRRETGKSKKERERKEKAARVYEIRHRQAIHCNQHAANHWAEQTT